MSYIVTLLLFISSLILSTLPIFAFAVIGTSELESFSTTVTVGITFVIGSDLLSLFAATMLQELVDILLNNKFISVSISFSSHNFNITHWLVTCNFNKEANQDILVIVLFALS
jgi:hypothetical protein